MRIKRHVIYDPASMISLFLISTSFKNFVPQMIDVLCFQVLTRIRITLEVGSIVHSVIITGRIG